MNGAANGPPASRGPLRQKVMCNDIRREKALSFACAAP
jgi:hypothetical protein